MDRIRQPTQRVDEADPCHGYFLSMSRFENHQADEIINQGVHRQFLLHTLDGFAMQHVHAQGLLQVPEIGFDLPTLAVEFDEVGLRITLAIEERRGQREDPGAAAALGDSDAHLTHRDGFR